ncbi:MAG: polysaccharide deacetylase family protein [Syntrophomonadaceae bacterium]
MRQFASRSLLPLLLVGLIFLAGCQASSREEAVTPPPAATEPAPAESPANPILVPAEPPASQPAAPNAAPAGEKAYSWWFTRNSLHQVPATNKDVNALLAAYDAFYVLPNDQKKIYLTFDCGYELGYSPRILDVLDRQQVRAAFFITGHYINTQPELVKRMHDSGHLVANHTFNHPDLPTVSQAKFNQELKLLEEKYKSVTGSELNRYLRPPNGNYSASTLHWAQEAQYKTVFWSMALADWDPNKQPGAEFVHQHVLNNIHPGAVILLHVVSQSDTEALEQIIIDLKNQGYRFSTF